jgi:hypothetical protein
MLIVPVVPTACSNARITATGPPQTQPLALNEEWTGRTIPSSTPSARRSAARDCSVAGAVGAARDYRVLTHLFPLDTKRQTRSMVDGMCNVQSGSWNSDLQRVS